MNQPSVLVVDDYPRFRDSLSEALQASGYTVLAAASGDEALELLESHQIDAVVLDLHMPVMSGQTLFHVIMGTWPELKGRVLIMTGDERAVENEAWLKLYDLPVLKKPFELREAISLIGVLTAVDRRQANSS